MLLSSRREKCDSFKLDFMRSVPTVWDETRGLDGRIGEWAAVARRSGETWYVGAITDWTARELDIPTDFLGGGEWQAEGLPRVRHHWWTKSGGVTIGRNSGTVPIGQVGC